MAFDCDQQVRIRLSRYAEEVIQNDMNQFQITQRNTFLNTIIENFYPDAQASISLRLDEYESYLESIIIDSARSKIKQDSISLLMQAEQKRLEALANSYGKPGTGCPNKAIRLKNNLYEYLTNEATGCRENEYNNYTLPKYLRIVIEEYARLPHIKREQIYYKNRYQVIQNAINNKLQLQICVFSGKEAKVYHILPYKIMEDPLSTTSYLVGYAYLKSEEKSRMVPCSFRISTIKDYRLEKSRSGHITLDKITLLEKKIESEGVQFLSSDNIDIKVKFTEHGLKSFEHQLNLRPIPITREGNIYTFHCSIVQARYYFFKFGRHAEILSPEFLRKEFKKKYQEAYKMYTD